MKLRDEFVIHDMGEEHFLVSTGRTDFCGLVKMNRSANDIIKMLSKETTEDKIIAAMREKYDASEDIIAADVQRVIKQARDAGLLDV